MGDNDYLTIKELAALLNISELKASYLAKSKRLRSVKGAVMDVNNAKGKYEILRVKKSAALKVFAAI